MGNSKDLFANCNSPGPIDKMNGLKEGTCDDGGLEYQYSKMEGLKYKLAQGLR